MLKLVSASVPLMALVQTHSEKRNQNPSLSSTAHDLNSALNNRDQDSLPQLASHNAALERPPPERDKLATTSADLLTVYLFDSALSVRDYDDYDADYDYASEKAVEEANYQRYLDFSQGVIQKPIIRVTLQEDAYQIDREGSISLASELSLADIGELFYLLLNADAEFASEDDVKVDHKAVEESIDYYGTKLKTPRTEAESTLDYFQRLSLLVFYEPDRLTEAGSTISATLAMWAEKFFVHGCVAYLLYLQHAMSSPVEQDAQVADALVISMTQDHLLHDIRPPQDTARVPVESATLFVGRAKCRWSIISPPSLRSSKAPHTPTKAIKASTTTRSIPCALGPESVTVLRTTNRPLGCRTSTNGWLATQASPKGAPDPQKTSTTNPVRNLRTVTEIYPSQVTAARVRVTDNHNTRPSPSKRALQRLRKTQVRKHYERLHSRRHPGNLYRTGEPISDSLRAVVVKDSSLTIGAGASQ